MLDSQFNTHRSAFSVQRSSFSVGRSCGTCGGHNGPRVIPPSAGVPPRSGSFVISISGTVLALFLASSLLSMFLVCIKRQKGGPEMIKTDNPVVLVVEDDPPVRKLLNDVLQEEGYEVVAVHDGSAALRVLESLKIDMITLDLDLPGLTGSDVVNMLRQRKVNVPPIIVITSYTPVKSHLRRIVQAVLPKPFDVDDLLARVWQLLPRRQLTRAKVYDLRASGSDIT